MKSIVTILVTLGLFFSADASALQMTNPQDLKTLHEKTFPIASGKKLKIETATGNLTVTSWDKEEVYVKILGNDLAKEKMTFDISADNEIVEIKCTREGSWFNWGRGIKVKYEIQVPAKFNNNLKTAGGDIHFTNISGDNLLRTSGGDITIKQIKGNLKVGTSGGDIVMENVNGMFDVSTSGGDIECKNFVGDIKASTSGGDIKLKGSDANIIAKTSGGDIFLDYNGDNKGIELRTSGGDIVAKLPENFNASADMSTSGGRIKCSFTANNASKISKTRFLADINNGGNKLIAKTSGGDISITQR